MENIATWYTEQYLNGVDIKNLDGSHKFKKLCNSFYNLIDEPALSGKYIMSNFISTKLLYPISKNGYICTMMSCKFKNITINYAFAYWRDIDDEIPEYICVSPTFNSQDGEFRRRFMLGSRYLKFMEDYIEYIEPFETVIIDMISKFLELDIFIFPDNDQVSSKVDNLRLPITALVVALILDLQDYHQKRLMMHVNGNYKTFLNTVIELYPHLLEIELNSKFRRILFPSDQRNNNIQCGQKLVPMFVKETSNIMDYNFSAWRELLITSLVNNLLINFISPSFAIFNQWSFIEKTGVEIFENTAMHRRYQRSDSVEISTKSLREARLNIKNYSDTNKELTDFDHLIFESIDFAQNFLKVSPITMMYVIGDVGKTMLSYTSERSDSSEITINPFQNYNYSSHFTFELAYAAYCLHTKLGVAHTDLHGNNMTFKIFFKIVNKLPSADPAVIYVIGDKGEADTFMFPACGATAYIIDYSRAIVGPEFRKHLEHNKPQNYADNFYKNQVMRVMRALYQYAPDFVETHQVVIKYNIITNFEAVFHVLCFVDYIAIGAALAACAEASPTAAKKETAKITNRLETTARKYFITGLYNIVHGIKQETHYGYELLHEVFSDFLISEVGYEGKNLVDAYNYNNKIKYDGNDFSKFPPWARIDQVMDLFPNFDPKVIFDKSLDPFFDSLKPSSRNDLIVDQIRSEQNKLDNYSQEQVGISWLR
jgi:hypothetical protein